MKDFIPCRKCVDKYTVPGYILKEKDSFAYVEECNCHKDWRQLQEVQYDAVNANIWSDDISLNYSPLKDYIGDESKKEVSNLMKYVENFENSKFNSAILYMWGTNGTQKTTIAQWVGLSILKKHHTVRYMNMHQLVILVSDFYKKEENAEELEFLKSVDLLILDESFDKQKVSLYKSGFQLPYIEDFLKTRIEGNDKSIIFISNISVADISKNGFSDSISSLIYRNTVPKNTVLHFKDVFHSVNNKINTDNIFA